MKLSNLKQSNLPDAPGVYYFIGPKLEPSTKHLAPRILYIGKATSLKDRVKSYFVRDILMSRSPLIAKMLEEAESIEFAQTDSVLEALILEASVIKKHQPRYNSREKDDKSYNYVTFTEEDFPKVIVTRGSGTYGPFPHSGELKEALKIIRKIFPYSDSCTPCVALAKRSRPCKPCFNVQLRLCPGPCANLISKQDYRKIIRHLKLFFEAKKTELIKSLEKEMKALAREHKFEEAEKIKRQIFALEHIQDIALIKQDLENSSTALGATRKMRVEAYDIAHISGTDTVGVMTVAENNELTKSQYRKFKIRNDKNDDTNNLKEIITRRLGHPEWPLPNLIVVDGGVAQINAALAILKANNLDINVVGVVKDDRHKAREILGLRDKTLEKLVLLANVEAHRFAIGFHRKLRGKGFRI